MEADEGTRVEERDRTVCYEEHVIALWRQQSLWDTSLSQSNRSSISSCFFSPCSCNLFFIRCFTDVISSRHLAPYCSGSERVITPAGPFSVRRVSSLVRCTAHTGSFVTYHLCLHLTLRPRLVQLLVRLHGKFWAGGIGGSWLQTLNVLLYQRLSSAPSARSELCEGNLFVHLDSRGRFLWQVVFVTTVLECVMQTTSCVQISSNVLLVGEY